MNRMRNVAVGTVKKSTATMSRTWLSRKVRHVCDGGLRDLTTEAGFTVTRTGWVFLGVSPELGLRWRRTRSNIDLFDRDSVSFIAGVALPY